MHPSAASIDREALDRTRRAAAERLLALRTPAGHWVGRLSSSALSTATAINALRLVDSAAHAERLGQGAGWLVATQLSDGSWGDTIASRGNLSTTLLCWASLAAVLEGARTGDDAGGGSHAGVAAAVGRAAAWIGSRAGGLDARSIARTLAGIYGRDRTFSVPILTHAVLCGRFGDPRRPEAWREVPQLPFELAALPQSWFRLVDMQVVSYALPALIAIGQVRHALGPRGGIVRPLRDATRGPTLRTLAAIQPANGGYLEATPLTSFVTMSLAGMGLREHEVARRGAAFLVASQRADGSWPIDTNLATWVTTQSVAALAAGGRLAEHLDAAGRQAIRGWLLGQQWNRVHPYTGAAPGGWAWTDLPGGVPDADDTSGAVVALASLEEAEGRPSSADVRHASADVRQAAAAGLGWLANLANRDGGIPTFCRGWGRLPFDTSCPDITAHALRGIDAWSRLPDAEGVAAAGRRLLSGGRRYLAATQDRDGSWRPLWFGNEHHADQANPTYGTAKVVLATLDPRGAAWLMECMSRDGGVGGGPGLPATIEETAVTVEALARVAAESPDAALRERAAAAVGAGVGWLVARTEAGTRFEAAPIGLYFAKLWYDEELYPLAFTVAALERAAALARAGPQRVG
jgi:squalene-hopene/tetraprenyl-beta-curcumene cyclase